jgi:hypothetical protein
MPTVFIYFFMVNLTTISITQIVQFWMKGLLVNNELKYMQKVATAHLDALVCYLIVGTAENPSRDKSG